ncbi:NYN domain-containing protein [uncultured Photobacterium sp.]|uniref:NYN domain-containing protein n=1 Tax=uncultured Photobacterium sp. TaxID=173973 RepID=UPI002616B474|nr:NYN domain-containing protein [uncultured Photobacterium sp.]
MKDKENLKIALFIDADNASPSSLDVVLSSLDEHGETCKRKAFGNWKNDNLSAWERILHKNGIEASQQFNLTKRKNATDIALVIDVMDTIHSKDVDIDATCIMTSDCDFTPLVVRLRQSGIKVIGAGERKTPPPLIESCSDFIYTDDIVKPIKDPQSNKKPCSIKPKNDIKNINQSNEKTIKKETDIQKIMHEAIKQSKSIENNHWYELSDIHRKLIKLTSNQQKEDSEHLIKQIYNKIITKLERKKTNTSTYIKFEKLDKKENSNENIVNLEKAFEALLKEQKKKNNEWVRLNEIGAFLKSKTGVNTKGKLSKVIISNKNFETKIEGNIFFVRKATKKKSTIQKQNLKSIIYNTIDKYKDKSGWINTQVLESKLSKQIKPEQYNFKSINDIIKSANYLDHKKTKKATMIKVL